VVESTWTHLRETLAERGLNHSGVADGRPYQQILPGCQSVVVFASGGTRLWECLLTDLRANPEHLTHEPNPLDAYVQRTLAQLDPTPDSSRLWVRCAATAEHFVDFRPLAQEAGLGWPSRLGLLIDTHWGPWVGLRAACFTTETLATDGPRVGPGPCEGCEAPCQSACPAEAVQPAGWDVERCSRFHLESTRCLGTCHARLACPVGEKHRHGDLQHRYHNDRVNGRPALALSLGIEGDHHEGAGPFWGDWS
jgi:hypothetical protein